jgi:hypothetical protein
MTTQQQRETPESGQTASTWRAGAYSAAAAAVHLVPGLGR